MSASGGKSGGSHGHGASQSLPEPSTPMWFTALGVVLFLAAGLLWALSPSPVTDEGKDASGAGAAGSASAQPAATGH